MAIKSALKSNKVKFLILTLALAITFTIIYYKVTSNRIIYDNNVVSVEEQEQITELIMSNETYRSTLEKSDRLVIDNNGVDFCTKQGERVTGTFESGEFGDIWITFIKNDTAGLSVGKAQHRKLSFLRSEISLQNKPN
jgi:hypothetical protein